MRLLQTRIFKVLVLLNLLIIPLFIKAGVVNEEEASALAKTVLLWQKNKNIDLSTNYVTLSKLITDNGQPLIYIYNFNPRGFVIISGDDNVEPLLAYSDENSYGAPDCPVAFTEWLDWCAKQIKYTRQKGVIATKEIKDSWNYLLSGNFYAYLSEKGKGDKSVSPLLTSEWNQGTYYNELCPADPLGPDGKVWAGCVAVAMAQVMNYYQYPSQGTGSHSFHHDQYGTLSANFGSTAYDWVPMVNSVNTDNLPVATLMYQCGVAVDMNYSPSGSGAFLWDAAYALKTYFKYSNTVSYYDRDNYMYLWEDLLTSNLDAGKPVIYAGFNPDDGSGHAFVIDGYDVTNHFHFNWGWSGSYNGYFYLDNLNPGTSDFTSGQQAVVNIYPSSNYPYYCSGTNTLTYPAGVINDGSGPGNYSNNADCRWLISPQGVDNIKLKFLKFNTENSNDKVIVYDGADETTTILGTFSGSSLPSTITSTGDKMFIRFITNGSVNYDGWVAEYSSTKSSYCDGTVILDQPSGSFTDGSGSSEYANNSNCKWLISPPDISSITINFTDFNVEPVNDFVRLIDPTKTPAVTLATYYGTSLPPSYTHNGSQMLVLFKTGTIVTYQGWSAEYTTTPLGVDENNIENHDLKLFPNPAHDFVNVEIYNKSNPGTQLVIINDMQGREVLKQSFEVNCGINNFKVPCNSLDAGLYLLRIINSENAYSVKLSIQ